MWLCCGVKWLPELTLVKQPQAWAEPECSFLHTSMETGCENPVLEMKVPLGCLVALSLMGI